MQIDVQGIEKRNGPTFTLQVPELHIAPGEAIGLVGNNGAGKTTLLRLLLDLTRPHKGTISLNGERHAENPMWRKGTGSYLDESFLIDFLTADEYWQFVGSTYDLRPSALALALRPFQSFYDHEPFGQTTKYLRELSKGNMKKIGLIAALFTQPQLLVLDEPFANLDPRSQLQLRSYLRTLHAERGSTMLLSSHDLLHVTDICDRILVLKEGVIVQDLQRSEVSLESLEAFFAEDVTAPIVSGHFT